MNRETIILELLSEHKKMEVSALAAAVGVSQVTIRKDLISLEDRGVLRREHGYAMLRESDDVSGRLAFHYERKKQIAQAAASLVCPGETVMIESGSCCALLAEELVKRNMAVTIITNSAFIAGYIRKQPGARVILLGGDYQNDSQVMVGPVLALCVGQFYVDKLFVGADGFTKDEGFTGKDHLRVQAVRDMAQRAGSVIVLTEHHKLDQRGVMPLALENVATMLVTDDQISDKQQVMVQNAGIRLCIAESAGE